MKVEIRINGSFHLELTPETPTEKLIVSEMLTRASKGKTIQVHGLPDGPTGMDVSVEAN
jgi:hypothetical protein